MSRIFAAGVATPTNWFSPVFPCLRNNRIAATIIPFPRTGPQVVPGHVMVPRVVCYLPYPETAPLEVVDFKPSDFGLTENETNAPLSSLQMQHKLKHGEFSDVSQQLNQVLSRGFEQGYFTIHASSTAQERSDARLAAELIARITPDGLRSVYRIAGKLLFDWIDRCAEET
jgi:hypothetical protein